MTSSPASLASVTLEVNDLAAAERFYADAFGLTAPRLRLRASDAPTSGFRGFTLSITVARPSDVDSFIASAVEAGATVIKPAAKSLWGYGGVVKAPDGTLWKLATSAKKDSGPATREIGELVLLLGVENVKTTKQFYVEQGLTVGKSFGSKYVEFAAGPSSPVKLALYKRPALAKDAGVPPEGTGSHRVTLGGTTSSFSDPDGFTWEAVTPAAASS
ncbi:glyoxalase [Streptomyces sp. NPDC052225]|uniref:glyoxalase n=1 Tax=Streptomyces sp. NPDC052225 TaxID=3154949 RepID=UPI00342F90EB